MTWYIDGEGRCWGLKKMDATRGPSEVTPPNLYIENEKVKVHGVQLNGEERGVTTLLTKGNQDKKERSVRK